MKPSVSIIVPVYSVEPYLRKCIDSIIKQTYKNLEIILVDDGSPDSCGDICDEYAARDERIIVIHKQNGGLSDARNAGLDVAKGDYVQFVDSDDWIEKDCCETAIQKASIFHADIVCFGYLESFPSGRDVKHVVESSGERNKLELVKELVSGEGVIRDYVWNKLFRRNLLDGIRFPKGRCFEDMDVTYKLFHRAYKIYTVNTIFYHYIRRSGSLAYGTLRPAALKDKMYIHKQQLAFLKQNYPTLVESQINKMLIEMMIGIVVLRRESDYDIILNEINSFIDEYESSVKKLTKYSRQIWLFYYCRPLSSLYALWRYVIKLGYIERNKYK